MKVYLDIFTGDELITDAYFQDFKYNGTIFEVCSREIEIEEQIDTSQTQNDQNVEDKQTIIQLDIPTYYSYEQISLTKNEFLLLIKSYLPKVKIHLIEFNHERVNQFMDGVTAFVKFVLTYFDRYTFWHVPNDYKGGMIVLSYTKPNETTPRFIYFTDGLEAKDY